MSNLTNEEKARIYNDLLLRYNRLQEMVRLIKAENFELNAEDQQKVIRLESSMRRIYDLSQKLYN